MYEYAPQFEKKKEKLLALTLAALGVGIYFAAYVPGVPFPGVIQLLAMGLIAATILILTMYVLRRYRYRVEAREGATETATPDFVIVEHYGRRETVVCRVSLSSILSVLPVDAAHESEVRAAKESKHFYNYTGLLFDRSCYCVKMEEGGTPFYILLCADERLLELLMQA